MSKVKEPSQGECNMRPDTETQASDGSNQKIEKQLRTLRRLGIRYDNFDVAPKNVSIFAKIVRIVGLLIVIGFVLWGLFSRWEYRRSPFESLLREFDIRQDTEAWSFAVALVIFVIGWRYRFQIGAIFSAAVVWVAGLVFKVFHKIFKAL